MGGFWTVVFLHLTCDFILAKFSFHPIPDPHWWSQYYLQFFIIRWACHGNYWTLWVSLQKLHCFLFILQIFFLVIHSTSLMLFLNSGLLCWLRQISFLILSAHNLFSVGAMNCETGSYHLKSLILSLPELPQQTWLWENFYIMINSWPCCMCENNQNMWLIWHGLCYNHDAAGPWNGIWIYLGLLIRPTVRCQWECYILSALLSPTDAPPKSRCLVMCCYYTIYVYHRQFHHWWYRSCGTIILLPRNLWACFGWSTFSHHNLLWSYDIMVNGTRISHGMCHTGISSFYIMTLK